MDELFDDMMGINDEELEALLSHWWDISTEVSATGHQFSRARLKESPLEILWIGAGPYKSVWQVQLN